eukprot:gene4581-4795_t
MPPKKSEDDKRKKQREKNKRRAEQRRKAEMKVDDGLAEANQAKRDRECKDIQVKMDQNDFVVQEVPSDGNCLYRAVELCLKLLGQHRTYQQLRKDAAEYIRSNPNDFMPFLLSASGDLMTPEQFSAHCTRIAESSDWGVLHASPAVSAVMYLLHVGLWHALTLQIFIASSAPSAFFLHW